MKTLVLFASFFTSFSLFAQYTSQYIFPEYLPTNTYLLKSAGKTVVIHPTDLTNQSHIWTTFDSSLAAIEKKRLVTPDGADIISQTYLEGMNTIIRIDQWIAEGQLHVSGYIFDVYGNILYKKELTNPGQVSTIDKNPQLSPFIISQSKDKNCVALVQFQSPVETKLIITTIVFDNKLALLNDTAYSINFDTDLLQIYSPVVDRSGTIFLIVTDKFDSYKLSSTLTCYQLVSNSTDIAKREFSFSRKKIKDLDYDIVDSKLSISASFSHKANKSDVAGILFSGYDYAKQEYLNTKEYYYNANIIKELKNIYGPSGYKSNILNYLAVLPSDFSRDIFSKYAYLRPPVSTQRVSGKKMTDAPPNDVSEIRSRMSFENSFVGTEPPGFSRPKNISEAGVYAALRQVDRHLNAKHSRNGKSEEKLAFNNANSRKNLLLFSWKNSLEKINYRFVKISSVANEGYNFAAYIPEEQGYSCVSYSSRAFGHPYLKKTTIDESGNVLEKIIFDDKDKVILSGYPYVLSQQKLIGFYEDKNTSQLGLISINL